MSSQLVYLSKYIEVFDYYVHISGVWSVFQLVVHTL